MLCMGGCRVNYCRTHGVAEVEIGAVSLRLDTEALARVKDLLNDAFDHLSDVGNAAAIQHALMARLKASH